MVHKPEQTGALQLPFSCIAAISFKSDVSKELEKKSYI